MITRIIAVCLLILGAGCAHVGRIATPTDEWQYAHTTEENAEFLLRVSISIAEVGPIQIYETHFKRITIPEPDKGLLLTRSIEPEITFHAEGRKSFLYYTVSKPTPTPAGITIRLHVSSLKDGKRKLIDQEINVSYAKSGLEKSGDVTYSWEWVEIKKPSENSAARGK